MPIPLSLRRLPLALRFAASGGFATAVHWACMALLIAAGMPPSAATTAGSIAGAAANYGLQRRYTFRSTASHRRAVPLYSAAVVAGWIVNAALFSALHDLAGLAVAPAQALTSLAVAVFNLWLYQHMVFA